MVIGSIEFWVSVEIMVRFLGLFVISVSGVGLVLVKCVLGIGWFFDVFDISVYVV